MLPVIPLQAYPQCIQRHAYRERQRLSGDHHDLCDHVHGHGDDCRELYGHFHGRCSRAVAAEQPNRDGRSAVDGDLDRLGFLWRQDELSAQVAGYNPLFNIEQKFALMAPPVTSNYFFNGRGAQEKYLVSGNGSNAAAGGYISFCPTATFTLGSAIRWPLPKRPEPWHLLALRYMRIQPSSRPPHRLITPKPTPRRQLSTCKPQQARPIITSTHAATGKIFRQRQRRQRGRRRVLHPCAQRQPVRLDRQFDQRHSGR